MISEENVNECDIDEDEYRINQGEMENSKFKNIRKIYDACKGVVKIMTSTKLGSGFFIKLEKGNSPFYCLMSNEHIIKGILIRKKKSLIIYYDNEFKSLEINLNEEERYIKTFKKIDSDISVVEILKRDKVPEEYFLLPDLDKHTESDLKNGQIFIPQYTQDQSLKNSSGIIKKLKDNEITHTGNTTNGSSGSPILFKDSIKVFGIHKQGSNKDENYGDLILPFINIIKNELKNRIILQPKRTIIIEYENRDHYIGDLINDIPNGKGKKMNRQGIIKYEGEFVDDKYEGKGTYYMETGEYYEGEFKNGTMNGEGKQFYRNNDVKYEGHFIDGKFEGIGKFIWDNGEYYIGEFKDGVMNGKGKEYYCDGTIKYDGEFENCVYGGKGKYIYKSGNYYLGQWKEGRKNGKGAIYTKDDKIKNEGDFVDGKFLDEEK